MSEKEVSKLELGRKLPSVSRICELSLIYGKSFESLYAELIEWAKAKLRRQVPSLPPHARHDVTTFNRDGTLERIKQRISRSTPSADEGA